MRNRARHSRQQLEGLRLTIDCMPPPTREAMLEGVRSNERIIVGAYVDEHGGVCPMLAAHRCGGRTDFLSFAVSWDRFTRAGRRTRPATRREVAVLVALLEGSLTDEGAVDLARAIAQHKELRSRRGRDRQRLQNGADPVGEILARCLPEAPAQGLPAGVLARGTERLGAPVPSCG